MDEEPGKEDRVNTGGGEEARPLSGLPAEPGALVPSLSSFPAISSLASLPTRLVCLELVTKSGWGNSPRANSVQENLCVPQTHFLPRSHLPPACFFKIVWKVRVASPPTHFTCL